MTIAPPTLLDVRTLLTAHLPGLTPATMGIVGDQAHRGGYHCGADRVDADDYSVRESPRDRAGLTDQASALDVGQFQVTVAGRRHDLRSMSVWLVQQCRADTPDTRDIREVIYSSDGQTVRRWDRLGIRDTGDASHRWHTHISFHRDAIKAGRDQRPLFHRWLTAIGLLREDTIMDTARQVLLTDGIIRAPATRADQENTHWTAAAMLTDIADHARAASSGVQAARSEVAVLRAQLAEILGRDLVDEQAIVDGVLAGLGGRPLDQVAAALVAALGPERAAELAPLLGAAR